MFMAQMRGFASNGIAWTISGIQEYTLEVSENITVDWVLYAESLAWDAPAGETLVEVGLKVVNYGTDRTPCPECEVRVTNTTLDLGAWWRVTLGRLPRHEFLLLCRPGTPNGAQS